MARLFKFLTVGASGVVISLSTLLLLTELAGWHYLLSYLVAFVLSISNNYYWNSKWTFKDKKSGRTGLGKYALVGLLALSIKELSMFVLTGLLGIWYMASAAIILAVVSLLNFTLSRKFVWNNAKKEVNNAA